MNLLVVSPRFPFPPVSGDRLRAGGFLRELSRMGFSITLFSTISDGLDGCEVLRNLSCFSGGVFLDAPDSSCPDHDLFPEQILRYRSPFLLSRLREVLRERKFDASLFFLCRSYFYFMEVKRTAPELPAVVDFIDALHYHEEVRGGKRAASIRRIEKEMADLCDAFIVTSRPDLERIKRLSPTAKGYVIPNGINGLEGRKRIPDPSPFSLAFWGNLAYRPNAESIAFLFRVVEELRTADRRYTLHIFGPFPERFFRREEAPEGIVFHGYVPDLGAALREQRCGIFMLPYFVDSGVQNKLLEALSYGLPCIVSEGVAERAGVRRGIVVSENQPEEFAKKALAIRDALEHLSEEAYEEAKRFSWERAAASLAEVFEGMAGNELSGSLA